MAVLVGLTAHVALAGWLDSAHPWYLGLFAMGCAAARYEGALSQRRLAFFRALTVIAWGLPAMLIVWGGNSFFQRNMAYLDTLIGVATALTLFIMLNEVSDGRPSRVTRLLSWPPLVRIGLFSYSLYLVHAPLLHVLDRTFTAVIAPGPEVMFILLVVSSPLIVGASYLFFLAFEKPCLTRAAPRAARPHQGRATNALGQQALRVPRIGVIR
jgi:peptidoglycan/LPS O-acetylase OafA/YrhL